MAVMQVRVARVFVAHRRVAAPVRVRLPYRIVIVVRVPVVLVVYIPLNE
jgi:hypothetical protein